MNKTSQDKFDKAIPKKEGEKIARDIVKQRGLGRLIRSFKYAFSGLKYAYKYEQSMLIHVIATILVITANILLNIQPVEWLATIIAIGMVLSAELINTAIEAIVDMITLEFHPLAKIAKDCGSAAVLVLALMAVIIGCFVYIPYIPTILKGLGIL